MMPMIPSTTSFRPNWRGFSLATMLSLILATQATAATDSLPFVFAQAAASRGLWIRSVVIFLAVSAFGGYVWYYGLFPRLLRSKNPSWPLDAWRKASYGAWLTICAAAWFFKQPLMTSVLKPMLTGVLPGVLVEWFIEIILLPVFALVGVLAIWNFRRDVANRARPA